jgi:ribonuclease P protein component
MTEAFVVLVCPTRVQNDVSRLGVTVSRKVGNAVVRNRVKRRIREWFRRDRSSIGPGFDILVIARPAAARLTGRSAYAALARVSGALR